jgi:hypothetical protein
LIPGQKQRQAQEVKNDITQNKASKKLKEREKIEEEKRMKEMCEAMENIRKKKEWYEDNAAKLGNLITAGGESITAEGITTAVASAPTVVFAGIGLVAAGAATYIHYRSLKTDLITMEEAQARRERDTRELEASKANLEVVLLQLSADSKSIVGSLPRNSPEYL